MKLLAGPLGTLGYIAVSAPWLVIIVLGIHGWPYYAAGTLWLIVGIPIIRIQQRRAKKDESERPPVAN